MNIIVISGPSNSGKTHLAATIVSVVGCEEQYTIAATRNNCRTRSEEFLLNALYNINRIVVFDDFSSKDEGLCEEICGIYDTNPEMDALIVVVTREQIIPKLLRERASVIRTRRKKIST